MEICVESFDGEKYTVDVGVDDTTADIRRKVASAAELCEDGFDMSFGEKLLAEGDDTTQLSAGDTVVLTKTKSQKDYAIAALRDLGETALTSERFKGLSDTKLIHLFLQAEVVTGIPSRFLSGGRFSELNLSGVPGVTAICDNFVADSPWLRTADLSGWSNVMVLGACFLSNCSALRTLDLSGWGNVTEAGPYFLSNCSSLTTLDLSGWGSTATVGNCFLRNCRSLRGLNLSGWNNVTHIRPYFVSHCSALQTLDLSGWNNVTTVGSCFLSNCSALTTLDLSGWNNVTQIGRYFLFNCSSLSTLDMSGWTSVTQIHPHFLEGCNIRTSSINVTGSSSVVTKYVHSRKVKHKTKHKCVCM